MTEKQILGFNPAPRLEHIAANIPSACRIANIALIDAMILPYDANLGRMEFSERTPPPKTLYLSAFRSSLYFATLFFRSYVFLTAPFLVNSSFFAIFRRAISFLRFDFAFLF
jgi:hypothetical protein